jgi:shikimate dehydrogenase
MSRYVMIGAPVTSVRTPPLLEARLRALGHPATVETVHVEPADLARFMADVRADASVAGLVVTMPHKRTVMACLDACTRGAARAGGVNAVKRLPEGLVGAQLDGVALVRALEARGAAPRGRRVALVGVGAAGEAIAWALVAAGAELTLIDLDRARAEEVAGRIGKVTVAPPGDFEILVNATPLGMRPDDDSPVPRELVRPGRVYADIVADPNRTRLAAWVEAAGATLVTGREMVQAQIDPIAGWMLSPGLEQEDA